MSALWKDRPLVGAVVFFAVVLMVSNLLLLVRRPPTVWQSASEVEAAAFRLGRLASRTAVVAPHSDAAVQLTYTQGDPCGAPLGLAVLGQLTHDNRAAGPETQLWFRLEPWKVFPRNPDAAASPTVLAARDEIGTDQVGFADAGHLRVVVVEPTLAQEDPPVALRLNNLSGNRRWAVASAVAPELYGLMTAHRCGLPESDLVLLRWLARSLRARVCDDLDLAGTRCYDTSLTLYRDRQVDHYRLDLRALGDSAELLALLLEVGRNPVGQPVLLTYRTLPGSTLGKPANLFFTRPRPSGELLSPQDKGFHGLRYEPGADLPEGTVQLQVLWSGLPDLGIPPVEESTVTDKLSGAS
ncbi:MAG: hypothetical protein SX243_06245 [Acidobacteriota bacterium]|nr:hypothetical protein [Acidobacteriota bacterium]